MSGDAGSAGTLPKTLRSLSAAALRDHLLSARRSIPEEEDSKIAEKRSHLLHQVRALESKKQARVKERLAQLDRLQELALLHLRSMGDETDQFCGKCEAFYESRRENKCSMEGCDVHTSCPECTRKTSEEHKDDSFPAPYWDGLMMVDANKIGTEFKEEQPDWPHESGFVSCWICEESYCNRDFQKHYQECREKASSRCGFRPPSYNNDGGYTCVPGHCGKKIDVMTADYCYPEDGICGTVCCSDCGDECKEWYMHEEWMEMVRCETVRCKEHEQQYCMGCTQ